MTKQVLHDLLSAAAKELFFIFGNSLYCRVGRVGMGSPLSTNLANAFLCHYEKE